MVDTCAETTADGDMTRCVAGLSSLIPQLFFSSPFGPSIGKPYLKIKWNGLARANGSPTSPSTVIAAFHATPPGQQGIQQPESALVCMNK